jgi:phosphoserine phosphatase RsbU/P
MRAGWKSRPWRFVCKVVHAVAFVGSLVMNGAVMKETREMRAGPRNSVVLIIDDDSVTSGILAGILRKVGFETRCAADGEQGITLAQTLRPDLILLDVHLPDMDGFAVCRQIQNGQGTADIPVIFISANEDASVKVRGFEAGGIDYITKPLAGVEVIARVKTHLRLKHAYDTLAHLQAERLARLAATQQMILPTPDSMPNANFAVSLKQINGAGGDFYDVIPVGEFLVDYVVADASGHDLETSLWTTAMKTLLHEHASALFDPPEILRTINRSLSRVMPEGSFFTVVYARLNRQTGRLTLANGGHPPAVCLMRDTPPSVIRQTGDVIGAFPNVGFDTTELILQRGDRFFLYTDGVIEKVGNLEKGIRNLANFCQTHRELSLDTMVSTMMADLLAQSEAQDDVVLMGVEM